MKSYQFGIPHLLVSLGLLLFSSCLTIEEHYTFKKNGSGSMEYVIDLSEMGSLMESFSEMGEGGNKDLGVMEMSEQVERLKAVPGIGKVKLNSKKKWVQRLSFSFKDITSLNSALNVLMPDSSGAKHDFFRWEGNTLLRTNNRHAYELGANMAKGDEEGEAVSDEDGLKLDEMLETMKYKYSFKFKRAISSSAMAVGVEKENVSSKEVRFDTDFAVIARDPKALDLTIDLQP